jgi:hypothetical protein
VHVMTIAKSPVHCGFWIFRRGSGQVLDFRLSAKNFEKNRFIVLYSWFSSQKSKMLFDHSIRPRQNIRRNRQTDLLGGLEIDDKIEFLRLLDR